MGGHRALAGLPFPSQLRRLAAALVGEDLDGVVLSHAATLLLQPPDPLPNLLDAFVSPRPAQPLGESGEPFLKAPAEALQDALLLLSPLL